MSGVQFSAKIGDDAGKIAESVLREMGFLGISFPITVRCDGDVLVDIYDETELRDFLLFLVDPASWMEEAYGKEERDYLVV